MQDTDDWQSGVKTWTIQGVMLEQYRVCRVRTTICLKSKKANRPNEVRTKHKTLSVGLKQEQVFEVGTGIVQCV